MRVFTFFAALLAFGCAAFPAYAYIGPGLGVVAVYALLGPVAAVIAAVLMIGYFPARYYWKKYKAKKKADEVGGVSEGESSTDKDG
jgi:hypothetical protein